MANFTRWPSIRLTMADRERLERLANASMHRYPATADYLAHEIERAQIVELKDASEDLVTMGSSVEFRDDVTGQVRRVVLVYPDKADVTAGRISVFYPGRSSPNRVVKEPVDRLGNSCAGAALVDRAFGSAAGCCSVGKSSGRG